MDWVPIRSRRHPAFWLPFALTVGLLVPIAFVSHAWFSEWQERVRDLAATEPEAARAETLRLLRIGTWSSCGVLAAFSMYLLRYFQLGLRQRRLPPAGSWSLGAFRALTGPAAERRSRLGLLFTGLLLAAAIGSGLAVERLIQALA